MKKIVCGIWMIGLGCWISYAQEATPVAPPVSENRQEQKAEVHAERQSAKQEVNQQRQEQKQMVQQQRQGAKQ